MKLLLEKYRKFSDWLVWRDIRVADVVLGGMALGTIMSMIILIIVGLL